MGKVENVLRLRTEIVLLFQANPGIWENYKGVALRLGRHEELVQTELVRMVELGLLEQVCSSGKNAIFRYVKPYIGSGSFYNKLPNGPKKVRYFGSSEK